jgi:hypothetical protein
MMTMMRGTAETAVTAAAGSTRAFLFYPDMKACVCNTYVLMDTCFFMFREYCHGK